jgi:hypothetical protein
VPGKLSNIFAFHSPATWHRQGFHLRNAGVIVFQQGSRPRLANIDYFSLSRLCQHSIGPPRMISSSRDSVNSPSNLALRTRLRVAKSGSRYKRHDTVVVIPQLLKPPKCFVEFISFEAAIVTHESAFKRVNKRRDVRSNLQVVKPWHGLSCSQTWLTDALSNRTAAASRHILRFRVPRVNHSHEPLNSFQRVELLRRRIIIPEKTPCAQKGQLLDGMRQRCWSIMYSPQNGKDASIPRPGIPALDTSWLPKIPRFQHGKKLHNLFITSRGHRIVQAQI